MKKCPYCAEEIQDEAIKCKHCGADLLKPPPGIVMPAARLTPTVVMPVAKRPPTSALRILIWVGMTLALIVAAAMCLDSLGSQDKKRSNKKPTTTGLNTAEKETRFNEAKSLLIKSQQLDVLRDMDWKSRDGYRGPFIVVGPTFFNVDYGAKRNFIKNCNTYFDAGGDDIVLFNIYEWRNGSKIGENSINGLKLY